MKNALVIRKIETMKRDSLFKNIILHVTIVAMLVCSLGINATYTYADEVSDNQIAEAEISEAENAEGELIEAEITEGELIEAENAESEIVGAEIENDDESYDGILGLEEEAVPAIPQMLYEDDYYSSYTKGEYFANGLNLVGASVTAGSAKFDPRPGHEHEAYNRLSRFRNQGSYNSCWAFATMATVEATYNKNCGVQGLDAYYKNSDFSERHLIYFTYHDKDAKVDPMGLTKGDINILTDLSGKEASVIKGASFGGDLGLAEEALAKGIGPVKEAVAGYADMAQPVSDSVKYSENYARLKNSIIFGKSDKSFMKSCILKYGAVGITYYEDNDMYTVAGGENYYGYINSSDVPNHGVAVIGWDDTVSMDSFKTPASQVGAFLCKNSSLASRQYFWMSYDCFDSDKINTRYPNAYICDAYPASSTEKVYEHDGSFCSYQSSGSNVSNAELKASKTFASVFTASVEKGKVGYLTEVMAKFIQPNSRYYVQIYKNPKADDPESGTPMLSERVTGRVSNSGYMTIALPKSIPFVSKDKFSVVIEQTMGGLYLAADRAAQYADKGGIIRNVEASSPGNSYFKDASGKWKDLCNGDDLDYTARIKAIVDEKKGYSIDSKKPKKVAKTKLCIGENLNLNINGMNDAHVSWSSSDETIATVNSEGVVTAKWKGNAVITGECNGIAFKHKIAVSKPAFKKKSLGIYLGTTARASFKNVATNSVSYDSLDSSVATVNSVTGEVYARKAGKTLVYAQFDDNPEHRIYYKLSVKKLSISSQKKKLSFTKKGSQSFTLKVKNANKYTLKPVFESSNTSVATVTSDGIVTTHAVGECDISVSICDETVMCHLIVE